jgi:hypothetical protein
MHLNIKPYLIILASIVLGFILIACLRSTRYGYGFYQRMQRNEGTMRVIMFSAFILFGMLAVPVGIKTFLSIQEKIGNGDHHLAKALSRHAREIVYGVWIFYAIGICIALPFMIKNGFFATATNNP